MLKSCYNNGTAVKTFSSTGWTPVLQTVEVEGGFVMQVIDWIGGVEPKPTINVYISPNGYTTNVNLATVVVGVSGPQGPQGPTGTGLTPEPTPSNETFNF